MTKYSLRVLLRNKSEFEGIALFSHEIPHSAMYECGKTCYYDKDDVQAVDCIDLDTGEVLFEINEDVVIPDDVDESNYNPYMGCDEIIDEPFDAFCLESEWQY
jgi:hypothetical protein